MKKSEKLLHAIMILPAAMSCGALLGLFSDFGFISCNILQAIKWNSHIFADQYAGVFLLICVMSPFSIIAYFIVSKLNKKENNKEGEKNTKK